MYNKIEWINQTSDSRIIQLRIPLSIDRFILANLDNAGFFRVNYDSQSWTNIIKQLNNLRNVSFINKL